MGAPSVASSASSPVSYLVALPAVLSSPSPSKCGEIPIHPLKAMFWSVVFACIFGLIAWDTGKAFVIEIYTDPKVLAFVAFNFFFLLTEFPCWKPAGCSAGVLVQASECWPV